MSWSPFTIPPDTDSIQSWLYFGRTACLSGPAAFNSRLPTVGKMETKLPQVGRQIKAQESGLGLLEGIINGMEQANRQMQMEEQRQYYSDKIQKRKIKTRVIRRLIVVKKKRWSLL